MAVFHNFESTETLRNGLAARFRAIRPDDKASLAEAFGKLDAQSTYTRFFRLKQVLTDQELKEATEVDFEKVVALVVTIESGGHEIIIAGGRYLTFNAAGVPSAEVAFLVEEDYHGLGIAGRLLKHLVRIAREKGVRQFVAEVLPQNKAMVSVFARCGLPMKQHTSDGVVHVTLTLV